METWSIPDDERRVMRPEPRTQWLWLALGAVILVAMAVVYYYSLLDLRPAPPEPVASAAPAPEASPTPVAATQPEPAIQHPLATETPPSLPTLDNSDAMARESIAGLIGAEAFRNLVIPKELVRRIVATVDNLPRQTAPRRAIPLTPVPGAFVPGSGNEARYAPYVRVLESIDTRALVQTYVRAYPLFQSAYEELGFPGRYFNDRLMEAIDDLLAAPEPAAFELVQSKVMYEFADPELEARSAGQKILIRMGVPNAQRVKAKLREIRRELIAAQARRPGS